MSKPIVKTTLAALTVALSDKAVRAIHDRKRIYNKISYLVADTLHHRSGRFKANNFAAIKSMARVSDALSRQESAPEAGIQ